MKISMEAWQKVQEADSKEIDDKTKKAIKDFLAQVDEFNKQHPEVKINEIS